MRLVINHVNKAILGIVSIHSLSNNYSAHSYNHIRLGERYVGLYGTYRDTVEELLCVCANMSIVDEDKILRGRE